MAYREDGLVIQSCNIMLKCLKKNDNIILKPYIWNDLYNNGRIEVLNVAKFDMKNKNLEGDSSPREKRGSE